MKTLDDLTGPVATQRKPLLEAEIQKQCVDWARTRGYWARKFSSISQRSVPDYLFSRFFAGKLGNTRIKFFTEFKREDAKRDPVTGKMSTEAQQDEQKAMIQAGWIGFECNDFEQFKYEVQRIEKTSAGDDLVF